MSAVGRRVCSVAVVVMMMTVVVVLTVSSLYYGGTAGVAITLLFSLPLLPLLLMTAGSPACRCYRRAGCDEHTQCTGAMSTYLGLGEGLRWLLVPDNTSLLRAFRFHRALFPARPFSLFFSLLVLPSHLLSLSACLKLYDLRFISAC